MPPLHRAYGVYSLVLFASALILSTHGRPQPCSLSVSPATGLVKLFPGNDITILCDATCLGPLSRGQLFWKNPQGERVPEQGLQRVTTISYNRWTMSRLLVRGGQQQDSGVYICEIQTENRLLQYPTMLQIEDTTTKDPGPVRGDIFIQPEPDLSPIRTVRSASRHQPHQPGRQHQEPADVPVQPLTLNEQSAEQFPLSAAAAAGNKENVVEVNDILFEFDPQVEVEESNQIIADDDSNDNDDRHSKAKTRIRRQVYDPNYNYSSTNNSSNNTTNDWDAASSNSTNGNSSNFDNFPNNSPANISRNSSSNDNYANSNGSSSEDILPRSWYLNTSASPTGPSSNTSDENLYNTNTTGPSSNTSDENLYNTNTTGPSSNTSDENLSNTNINTTQREQTQNNPFSSTPGFSMSASSGMPTTSSSPGQSADNSTTLVTSSHIPTTRTSEPTPTPGYSTSASTSSSTTTTASTTITTTNAATSTAATTTTTTTNAATTTTATTTTQAAGDEGEDSGGVVQVGGDTSRSTKGGEGGETDFGRYGLLAFALALALALLLLYALLLVICVPRYCKQRRSHDLNTATRANKEDNREVFSMGSRSRTPLGPMTSATGLNGEYITSVDLDTAASTNNSGGGGGSGVGKTSDGVDNEPNEGSSNDAKDDAKGKATDGDPEDESPDRFVSTFLIGRLSSSKPTDEETPPPNVMTANDDNVFSVTSSEASNDSAKQDPVGSSEAIKEDGGHPLDSSDANTSSSSSNSDDDSSAPPLADKGSDSPQAPLAKAESDDAGLMSEINLTVDPAGIFVSKPTDV